MSDEPIDVAGIPGRYATALFELAEQTAALDAVMNDLSALDQMLDESDDLSRLIRSPVIGADDQQSALTSLADKAGFHDVTRKFVGVVARNRRLFALPGMIRAYRALIAQSRGEVTAEVTSASELSADQMSSLESALRGVVGRDVAISAKVDPDILGGLIVKVGSRMFDSSIRTKLQRLQFALKGAA